MTDLVQHLGYRGRVQQCWLTHRQRLQVALAQRLDLLRHLHGAGQRAARSY